MPPSSSFLAIMLSGTIIASPASASPFDGQYSPRGSDARGYFCSLNGGDYWSIRNDWFAIEDGGCQLSNPVAVRDMDAVLYDATCNFEGVTSQSRLFIGGQRDGIIVVSSSGYSYDLVRCR